MHESGYGDATNHAVMLLDAARTRAYAEAIAREVTPDDVVLDIGAGSGILSLLAARAGARKVFALERTGMVEIIRAAAVDNGVAERLELVRADLNELEVGALSDPPSLIVSEMLGHFAPDEDQHRLYQRALRHALPDARTIPRSYRVSFSLARPAARLARDRRLEDVEGIDMRALRDRLRNRVDIEAVPAEDLLGPESSTHDIDVAAPLPRSFTARCPIQRDGEATALVASFEATLSEGVVLVTHPSAPATHWQQVVFPVHPPLSCRAGDEVEVEVTPRVVTRSGTYTWSVRRGDEVRRGDSLRAMIGGSDDLLGQLGLRRKPVGTVHVTSALRAWAAILGGTVEGDVAALTARLMKALPDEFPDEADARQEVLRLLDATRALR